MAPKPLSLPSSPSSPPTSIRPADKLFEDAQWTQPGPQISAANRESASTAPNPEDRGDPKEETNYGAAGLNWVRKHPIKAAAMGVGGVAVAAPGAVAVPVLGALGFGTGAGSSIVGGSIAAGIQSTIGSVGAGSWFAALQSAGAGGYGVAIVNGVVQGVGAVGMGVNALTSALAGSGGTDEEQEGGNEGEEKSKGEDEESGEKDRDGDFRPEGPEKGGPTF